jgi:hypothetical protein
MPTDGTAFLEIEEIWPYFNEEPCNVRFSLETNGVKPFGELMFVYSVWPVFVINNNPPPWMSIKGSTQCWQ